MGRKARNHDKIHILTLFDWQAELIMSDIKRGKFKNRRDAHEDFLLEHYAKKNHQAAEYLGSKKLARRAVRR